VMQCISQKALYLNVAGVSTLVNVPCGKCIPCLMNKRGEWSFRLQQEHRVSKSAHFVTLTIDEKHLRTDNSLEKRDLQLYLKRLRKKDETVRIRYYAVGEYGTKNGRPHYHIILFNSNERDIRMSWTDSKGQAIGLVHVGTVTPASVAYVTKYIIQKYDYPEGVEKPFATMSRAYGIGGRYLSDEMVAWHRGGDFNFVCSPGNVKGRLPRFYRSKIWYSEYDKGRISKAAMELVQEKRRKEMEYWETNFPLRAEQARLESMGHLLERVKQKIAYSQKF